MLPGPQRWRRNVRPAWRPRLSGSAPCRDGNASAPCKGSRSTGPTPADARAADAADPRSQPASSRQAARTKPKGSPLTPLNTIT